MPLIEKIIVWALALITKFSYAGIFLTMSLESAAIPIPSEVVLPFSGFLASSGKLDFWLVIAVATLANLFGSVVIFYVGYLAGRPLIERYGKYVLIHEDDIKRFDGWEARYGSKAAFFSRLLPGVRTFSSLVLGAGKTKFKNFFIFTFLGSLVWNASLTYVGFVTGSNWNFLRPYFSKFEIFIAAAIAIVIILFISRHIRKNKNLS